MKKKGFKKSDENDEKLKLKIDVSSGDASWGWTIMNPTILYRGVKLMYHRISHRQTSTYDYSTSTFRSSSRCTNFFADGFLIYQSWSINLLDRSMNWNLPVRNAILHLSTFATIAHWKICLFPYFTFRSSLFSQLTIISFITKKIWGFHHFNEDNAIANSWIFEEDF